MKPSEAIRAGSTKIAEDHHVYLLAGGKYAYRPCGCALGMAYVAEMGVPNETISETELFQALDDRSASWGTVIEFPPETKREGERDALACVVDYLHDAAFDKWPASNIADYLESKGY